MRFGSVLEAMLWPSWPLFREKSSAADRGHPYFSASSVFSCVFRLPGPSWDPFSVDSGFDFGGPGLHFGSIFGAVISILAYLGGKAGTGWAGGVTRSEKNFLYLCSASYVLYFAKNTFLSNLKIKTIITISYYHHHPYKHQLQQYQQ